MFHHGLKTLNQSNCALTCSTSTLKGGTDPKHVRKNAATVSCCPSQYGTVTVDGVRGGGGTRMQVFQKKPLYLKNRTTQSAAEPEYKTKT